MELDVNQKKLTMEVDTGASVSIISINTYQKLFSATNLNLSTKHIQANQCQFWENWMLRYIYYGSQVCTLSLTVVDESCPSLLGRDWLTFDWKTVGLATLDMCRTQVEALQKKYKDVFSPGLGVLKNFKAYISVKQGARPVFTDPDLYYLL